MNYRGKVLVKYSEHLPKKFLKRMEGRNDYIKHEHSQRMDSLFIKAFILSQRDSIEKVVPKGYRELLTPEEVVETFVYNRYSIMNTRPIHNEMDQFYFEVDALDLKFNPDSKEFSHIPDFTLYSEEIKIELLSFIQKRFAEIDSKTLVLF